MADMLTSVAGYDQCLQIQHGSESPTSTSISGQFCLLELNLSQANSLAFHQRDTQISRLLNRIKLLNHRYPLTLGICVPSVCDENEINFLFSRCKYQNQILIKNNFNNLIVFDIPLDLNQSFNSSIESKVEHCQQPESNKSKTWLQILYENNLLVSM